MVEWGEIGGDAYPDGVELVEEAQRGSLLGKAGGALLREARRRRWWLGGRRSRWL